ncbi:hypothetical protein H4Q26_016648 [Puccinia striiformis f. sp. tritici PST-130]|nr:hypothetical protein H4Q26_016648 [Puccinia striiformis f. sp. tritici PST-130]
MGLSEDVSSGSATSLMTTRYYYEPSPKRSKRHQDTIDQMRHYEFRASDGRLRTLKATILSQKLSRPVWVGDIIDDDPVLLRTISEKIEAAFKLPDAAWSRD